MVTIDVGKVFGDIVCTAAKIGKVATTTASVGIGAFNTVFTGGCSKW